MARTLSSRSLSSALGRILTNSVFEDTFPFLGTTVTLRNLTKEEMDTIAEELVEVSATTEKGNKNVQYITEYIIRHLQRAIQQIDDADLRGVGYILNEDGEKEEVFLYLRNHFFKQLSSEGFSILWEKFSAHTTECERRSREGIKFITPNERPDETIDRLLGEVATHGKDIPSSLLRKLLEKHGMAEPQVLPTSEVDYGDDGATTDPPSDDIPDTDPHPVSTPNPSPSAATEPPHSRAPVRDASSLPLKVATATPRAPVEAPSRPLPADMDPSIPIMSLAHQELAILERKTHQPRTQGGNASPAAANTVPVDLPPPVGINPRFKK
jgi:hypothetical protein